MLDVFVRRGMPGVHLDLPHIPGGDIVGIVDALGVFLFLSLGPAILVLLAGTLLGTIA